MTNMFRELRSSSIFNSSSLANSFFFYMVVSSRDRDEGQDEGKRHHGSVRLNCCSTQKSLINGIFILYLFSYLSKKEMEMGNEMIRIILKNAGRGRKFGFGVDCRRLKN